ncbi:hypothetical protein BDR03DRAFT_952322 [Suillus americanus]|nr:hypothetical protein BDR03DRAFT_952322 [Suillus americanus]
MRFILAVIAALSSSVFAIPADLTSSGKCPSFCLKDSYCSPCSQPGCVSTSTFPRCEL